MNKLELNQMEKLEAGDGFWSAFSCGLAVLAAGAVIAGTGGTGAIVGYYVAGAACGGILGYAGYSGEFL